MKEKKSVCALIVTYNRKEYLKKLLQGLEQQTYPIDSIIIFDNASSDQTYDSLIEWGWATKEINHGKSVCFHNQTRVIYFKNSENLGGSGGFHYGLKLAFNQNASYIWAMDDDVLPEKNCLEQMMNYISEESRICIPCRGDKRMKDFAITQLNMSNPFKYSVGLRKTMVESNQIMEDYVTVVDMAFEGPLIHRSIVEEIGYPRKDLFILFDDSEYAYRASTKTEIRYIKNAILHKQIIPQKKNDEFLTWKSYYGFRNQYWFDRTYGKNYFVKVLRPIFHYIDTALRIIYKHKWNDFVILNAAYQDGTKGLLGRKIKPDENYREILKHKKHK